LGIPGDQIQDARDHRLYLAAGIRVHDHLAGQFNGAWQFPRLDKQCPHTDLTLRRLGQKDAAVRQALRAVAVGRWRCIAVGRGHRPPKRARQSWQE